MTTTYSKVQHILKLLVYLHQGQELYVQDKAIQEELGIDERTLRRYLNEIHELFGDTISVQKLKTNNSERKTSIYRAIHTKTDIAKVFDFLLENNKQELTWIMQMIHEGDPDIFKNLEKGQKDALSKLAKDDQEVFLFVSNPFETLEHSSTNEIFHSLKEAVKHNEYRSFYYLHNNGKDILDAKCLKLIFSNANWYIAIENAEGKFRLLRLSFIHKLTQSTKATYPKSIKAKYKEYFKTMQNAMSLFHVPKQKAILHADPKIAMYFYKGMKPFFASQHFIKQHDDGSVDFSIEYTQYLEIAPFIKSWLPNIHIREPESLRTKIMDELIGYTSTSSQFMQIIESKN